jgi:hypothetical protein
VTKSDVAAQDLAELDRLRQFDLDATYGPCAGIIHCNICMLSESITFLSVACQRKIFICWSDIL